MTSWTRSHQYLLGAVFVTATAAAIVLDLVLVLVLNVDSISWRTWEAAEAHPTLSVAGVFATVLVCWLVRGRWGLVMFAGFLGGHLFSHW